VNENIIAAFVGRDKAIAFLVIEEFYSASFHRGSFDCSEIARIVPFNVDHPGDCERPSRGTSDRPLVRLWSIPVLNFWTSEKQAKTEIRFDVPVVPSYMMTNRDNHSQFHSSG